MSATAGFGSMSSEKGRAMARRQAERRRGRYIPNVQLRREVQRAVADRGWSWSDVATASGLDHNMLNRALGRKQHHRTTLVRYEDAVRVVRALGLDPVDFDV